MFEDAQAPKSFVGVKLIRTMGCASVFLIGLGATHVLSKKAALQFQSQRLIQWGSACHLIWTIVGHVQTLLM